MLTLSSRATRAIASQPQMTTKRHLVMEALAIWYVTNSVEESVEKYAKEGKLTRFFSRANRFFDTACVDNLPTFSDDEMNSILELHCQGELDYVDRDIMRKMRSTGNRSLLECAVQHDENVIRNVYRSIFRDMDRFDVPVNVYEVLQNPRNLVITRGLFYHLPEAERNRTAVNGLSYYDTYDDRMLSTGSILNGFLSFILQVMAIALGKRKILYTSNEAIQMTKLLIDNLSVNNGHRVSRIVHDLDRRYRADGELIKYLDQSDPKPSTDYHASLI